MSETFFFFILLSLFSTRDFLICFTLKNYFPFHWTPEIWKDKQFTGKNVSHDGQVRLTWLKVSEKGKIVKDEIRLFKGYDDDLNERRKIPEGTRNPKTVFFEDRSKCDFLKEFTYLCDHHIRRQNPYNTVFVKPVFLANVSKSIYFDQENKKHSRGKCRTLG